MGVRYYPFLTGLILFCLQTQVLASPVLLWSNKNLPESPVPLSALSSKNLISNELCQLKDEQVQLRLFAVNHLTVEDIQRGPQRTHSILLAAKNEKSHFRYYPNIVKDVYKTFSLLPQSNDMKCSHIHFQISSSKTFETIEEALDAIQTDIDRLGPDSTNAVVIALISGSSDSSRPVRQRRQTTNKDGDEEVLISSDKSCMFYAGKLHWNNANGTKSTGQTYELVPTNSSCQPGVEAARKTVTLDLLWRNDALATDLVRMSLVATIRGLYWYLDSATLNNTAYLYFAYGMQSLMDTPPNFSYVCNSAVFVRYDMNSTKYGTYNFNNKFFISDLQFQPFNGDGLQFGQPNYCTSFFTSGIWMGITSSLLCLGILLFGVHRLMSIKSNDRFDDPKGKPLLIKAQE